MKMHHHDVGCEVMVLVEVVVTNLTEMVSKRRLKR